MTIEEAEKYAENMTYREAIYNLKQAKSVPYRKATFIKVNELLDELEQEPFMNKACVSSKVCEHDKEVVLDKIRAEIDKARFIDKDTKIVKNALASGLEVAMQIIGKYTNDKCDKGCDFCEHTSECMPS